MKAGLTLFVLLWCFTQQSLKAQETKLPLRLVKVKQGCFLKYPKAWKVLEGRYVTEVDDIMQDYAKSAPPAFAEKVKAASLAFAAVDEKQRLPAQVTLIISPPELSQAELKTFNAEEKLRLRDLMHQHSAPQFQKLGVQVTKKHPPRIQKGVDLSYFVWSYEFTDKTKIPQVSFRAYYYTKTGTYTVGISSSTEFAKANSKELLAILKSFKTSG